MNKQLFIAALLLGVGLALAVRAEPPQNGMPPSPPLPPNGPPVFAGKTRMNGYALKDFPDFIKQWHFVTVRYRKDTGEMRFTYANDKAWKALLAGAKDYPDGAVFAKVGVMTQEDPSFTSSAVPGGAKRYQLMVMDHKKHPGTDGWGYAIFDFQGKTFEENPENQIPACHACHKLVPERGYVFSQPMQLEVGLEAARGMPQTPDLPGRVAFATVPASSLSPKIKAALPPGATQVRLAQGELSKNVFQGTIDEIRPMLTLEALRSHLPAVLANESGERFSMVLAKQKADPCDLPNGKKGTQILAVFTIKPGSADIFPIQNLSYCAPGF